MTLPERGPAGEGSPPARDHARALARTSLDRGEPTAWFEHLYAEAAAGQTTVPWADLCPHALLQRWLAGPPSPGRGRSALVVGCGLGDDTEAVARRGWAVTAFDISPTAIAWCRRRFPRSRVAYEVADLLHPPRAWIGAFALVVEVYTLQALPPGPRGQAMDSLARLVEPRGSLLLITRAREPHEEAGELPWPLTREELQRLEGAGLQPLEFDDLLDTGDPPVRRFRVRFRRP